MNNLHPDKRLVADSFGKAAARYDDVAVLQRRTADEMLARLPLMKIKPHVVLDLGAGTGRNLAQLGVQYPKAQRLAVDIAPAMLQHARTTDKKARRLLQWRPGHRTPYYIAGDAERLPLAGNSVDLVFANLTLQWCEPTISFAEISRVLKPGGLLMFTTLGPDTLTELRQSWAAVDTYPHVNMFYDMHDVGDAMMAAHLVDPVLDVERCTLTYKSAMDLMRDLKQLGARNMNPGRQRGLTGKKKLQQVMAYYEQFRSEAGLPASYEVIYGQAWGGDCRQVSTPSGDVRIAVDQIQRRKPG